MNLDYILKPEQRSAGLHLEEDEDFVYLTRDNKRLVVWHNSVTLEKLLATADQYIAPTPLVKLGCEGR